MMNRIEGTANPRRVIPSYRRNKSCKTFGRARLLPSRRYIGVPVLVANRGLTPSG